MKNDSSKDAKTNVDKEECNKPDIASNRDQKNDKVSFQQSKVDPKKWKKI